MRKTERERRGPAPRVEPLESLSLLSGFTPALPSLAAEVSARAAGKARTFDETARGVYTVVLQNPDTGRHYHVTASGFARGIGRDGVTGTLNTPGFIRTSRATGTLTVTAPRGTFALDLVGPTQPGFSDLPKTFTYTITGGTGAYAGANGSGTVDVTLRPSRARPGASVGTGSGRITLVFHHGATPATAV